MQASRFPWRWTLSLLIVLLIAAGPTSSTAPVSTRSADNDFDEERAAEEVARQIVPPEVADGKRAPTVRERAILTMAMMLSSNMVPQGNEEQLHQLGVDQKAQKDMEELF